MFNHVPLPPLYRDGIAPSARSPDGKMRLRRYVCTSTTDVTEAGMIYEEILFNPGFFCPVSRIERPEVGVWMRQAYVDTGWFSYVDEIELSESVWFGFYDQEIKAEIEQNQQWIQQLSTMLTEAHQRRIQLSKIL